MLNEKSKVYILDDDQECCESLQWLLQSMDIQAEIFNDSQIFLNSYHSNKRGCLLLDIRMPKFSGLQVLEYMKAQGNQMPVIIISGHADVPLAIRAMKMGAFDLITKPFNEHQLLERIYEALEKDKSNLTLPNREIHASRYANLTAREKEILEFIVDGKLNKEIAGNLKISIKTVELHRSNLMRKMYVKNVSELMKVYFFLNKVL